MFAVAADKVAGRAGAGERRLDHGLGGQEDPAAVTVRDEVAVVRRLGERAVVEACDFADKPVRGQATPRLRVVADALGVSEPSVCRIRRAALERMREALAT